MNPNQNNCLKSAAVAVSVLIGATLPGCGLSPEPLDHVDSQEVHREKRSQAVVEQPTAVDESAPVDPFLRAPFFPPLTK